MINTFIFMFQIQLTPQQLQAIQMQLQGKQSSNQPIIIQQSAQQPVLQTFAQSDQSQFGSQVCSTNQCLDDSLTSYACLSGLTNDNLNNKLVK